MDVGKDSVATQTEEGQRLKRRSVRVLLGPGAEGGGGEGLGAGGGGEGEELLVVHCWLHTPNGKGPCETAWQPRTAGPARQ